MKKNCILLFSMTLIIAFCFTPSAMAKKIEYLGHYYNGKVNKQKNPEGEGGILIADVAVFGTFNANNITNVKIETDWIKISGAISFDESDRIMVKAGSNISSTVYLSSTMKYISTEESLKKSLGVVSHVFQKTLEKDSIVDLASTHADFYVSAKIAELAPNPPTIMSHIHAELVPIEISHDVKVPTIGGGYSLQTAKRQTKIYKVEKRIEEIEYRLDNYKDKYGRIWNVSGPKTQWLRCAGKVTYPNGSYIKTDEEGIVKEWEINYPNGFVLKYNQGTGERVIYSDGTIIDFTTNYDRNFNYYISRTTLYYAKLYKIIFPKSQTSKLSNKEIAKLINEKISQAFVNYKFKEIHSYEKNYDGLDVYDGDSYVGDYNSDEGVYISNKERDAKKNAAEAAEAKALKADIAKFKSKYGFDPINTSWKQTIKAGRSVAAFDASNAFLEKHGYEIMRVKLTIDNGTSKCYDMYKKGVKQGYFWIRGGRITSVVWR